MGEGRNGGLRAHLDARVPWPGRRLEFQGAKVTSDAGLLAVREMDEALGLSQLAESMLGETRTGRNVQHELVALLRQSVYRRLALFVLAYNLGNFLRRLVLPRSVRHWSLRSVQAKLIKPARPGIGAKVVAHSRRIIFQMAEVAVPRALLEAILKRIGELPPAAA